MKFLGKIVLISSFVLLGSFTLQAQKIGYVNSQQLLQEMPKVKAANAEIEALQKQLQKKGESMVTSLQAKYQDLQRKEAEGELSPKQIQDEAAKLQTERDEIASFEQDMTNQIIRKQEELLQPILDEVNLAIEKVAKEGGYTIVLDGSGGSVILYGDPAADLTAQVKSALSN